MVGREVTERKGSIDLQVFVLCKRTDNASFAKIQSTEHCMKTRFEGSAGEIFKMRWQGCSCHSVCLVWK